MSQERNCDHLLEEIDALRRKVEKLEDSLAKLGQAEAQKRAILDGIQTNIAFVNRDLEILWVNKCAADSVAATPSEMVGRKCHELWADPAKPCEGCPTVKTFETGKSERTTIVTPDGKIWDERGEPVFDSHGNLTGVIEIAHDVTATKKLQQERDRLFNLSVDMLAVVGFDGYFKQANPAWSQILGWSPEELLAMPAIELVHPEDRESTERSMAELTRGRAGRCKNRCRCKNGLYRWISWNSYPLPEEHLIFAVARDVTEEKQIEEARREQSELYHSAFEHSPISLWQEDWSSVKSALEDLKKSGIQDLRSHFKSRPDRVPEYSSLIKVLDVNQRSLELFGASEKTELLQGLQKVLIDESRDATIEQFVAVSEGRTEFEIELPNETLQGKRLEIQLKWCVAPGHESTYSKMLISVVDVTERRSTEEALKRSEGKYKLLFDNAPVGILSIDSEGHILEVNQKFLDLMGSPSAEATKAINMFDYTPLVDAGIADVIKRGIRGEQVTKEVPYTSKWGKYTYLQVAATPIRDKGGGVTGCQAVMEDITRRKKAEERQRLLATAVEQADEVVIITDVDGRIQYANPAFERVSGFGVEEAASNPRLLLNRDENDDRFYKALWDTITTGKVWKGRLASRKKNGDLYHEEATISPVRDLSGKLVNFVAVKRDITEHLELSQQLFQAQKMEAIGTLAGGIAHDFNNLLQVTLGYSELMLSEKSEDDPDYGDLKRIHQAAASGAELVQRLLAFSRRLEPSPKPLDLNKQIISIHKLLRRTIPRMIDIRRRLSEDLDRVNADPALMEQMLMNLAINARDAMPEGGILAIETRNITLDKEFCRHHVGSRPGKYVLLAVSDTGHGMDRHTVEHIFEPFFTTKQLERGTGLGLAMVYGIVKQHDGYITCESEAGKGTVFSVYFPAVDSIDRIEDEAKATKPPSGAETVLLVEDEELVRELGVRILAKAGYKVLTACNGKEGLSLFRSRRQEISLVILDLIMPEMGGKRCLQEILSVDPGMKVLIASGHSPGSSVRACIELGAKGFVSKPFNIEKLGHEVRQVLDAQ